MWTDRANGLVSSVDFSELLTDEALRRRYLPSPEGECMIAVDRGEGFQIT